MRHRAGDAEKEGTPGSGRREARGPEAGPHAVCDVVCRRETRGERGGRGSGGRGGGWAMRAAAGRTRREV